MEKEEMMTVTVTIPKTEYAELLDTRTRVDVLIERVKREDGIYICKEEMYETLGYLSLADEERKRTKAVIVEHYGSATGKQSKEDGKDD